MVIDQNWMSLPRTSYEFKMSFCTFLDDMFSIGNQMLPLQNVCEAIFHYRENVYDHLIVNGFFKGFKQ